MPPVLSIALSMALLSACAHAPESSAVGSSAPSAPSVPAAAPAEAPTVRVDLPADVLFPEGVTDGGDGTLWVGGFGSGHLLRVDAANQATVFNHAAEGGLKHPVGLVADAERGRLWVADVDPATYTSRLLLFDTRSGALLASQEGPAAQAPHFFNELVLSEDGTLFVSDTLQPRVWCADRDLSTLSICAQDALLANPDPERALGLNGLALTPDGRFLVGSVMDRMSPGGGRLVRIDPTSGEVQEVVLSGDTATFGGSDGMFFGPAGRLLMVNVTPPSALMTADFAADYAAATLTGHASADGVADRVTSTALRGDRLWVVNSQLDHFIDDGNGAVGTPPAPPFQIVAIPATGLGL